jgi:hypothetical protein
MNKLIYGTNSDADDINHIIVAAAKVPLQCTDSQNTNKQPTIGLTEEIKEDKVKTIAMIPHDGPVLKARCNPFKINQIASKSESGVVSVYDYFDYNKEGKTVKLNNPNPLHLQLKGHTSDGFGLCWNQKR